MYEGAYHAWIHGGDSYKEIVVTWLSSAFIKDDGQSMNSQSNGYGLAGFLDDTDRH